MSADLRPHVVQCTVVAVVPTSRPEETRVRVRESLHAFLADELGWDGVMVVVDAGEVTAGA